MPNFTLFSSRKLLAVPAYAKPKVCEGCTLKCSGFDKAVPMAAIVTTDSELNSDRLPCKDLLINVVDTTSPSVAEETWNLYLKYGPTLRKEG